MVESGWRRGDRGVPVVVVVVAVFGWMVIVSRTVATTGVAVAQRRADIVAMTVVEGVVAVKVVVVIVGRQPVVMVPMARIAVIPVMVVRMMISPSPAIGEPIVVPPVTIVIRTVGVAWPPPIITHVNAYAPVVWVVIVPVQVCIEGIIVTPPTIQVGVETTDARSVIIVIVIILVIIIVIGDVGVPRTGLNGSSRTRSSGIVCVLDERFADAWIVRFRVNQSAVFIIFVDDGIGLDSIGCLVRWRGIGLFRGSILPVLRCGVNVVIIGV